MKNNQGAPGLPHCFQLRLLLLGSALVERQRLEQVAASRAPPTSCRRSGWSRGRRARGPSAAQWLGSPLPASSPAFGLPLRPYRSGCRRPRRRPRPGHRGACDRSGGGRPARRSPSESPARHRSGGGCPWARRGAGARRARGTAPALGRQLDRLRGLGRRRAVAWGRRDGGPGALLIQFLSGLHVASQLQPAPAAAAQQPY